MRRGARRRGRWLRTATRALIAAVLVCAAVAIWYAAELRPVSASPARVRLELRSGAGPLAAARALAHKGLVRSEQATWLYAVWATQDVPLKAGVYMLTSSLSTPQIIRRLQRGPVASDGISVVIPEGFTARQIANRLAKVGAIRDADAFLEVVRKDWRRLRTPFRLPPAGLEGYLYPDTYQFPAASPPDRVAQAMLDTFERRFYSLNLGRIGARKRSLNEIVTIASLIEREAEVPQDRARIAGVIENRLKKSMRLQIDATVLYALGRHKDRVLYGDLRMMSPYNTYRRRGLPPGAIANPGAAALEAALAPESHSYLFYVATPDRSHVFTRTLAEHYREVARMRALRRRLGGAGGR